MKKNGKRKIITYMRGATIIKQVIIGGSKKKEKK